MDKYELKALRNRVRELGIGWVESGHVVSWDYPPYHSSGPRQDFWFGRETAGPENRTHALSFNPDGTLVGDLIAYHLGTYGPCDPGCARCMENTFPRATEMMRVNFGLVIRHGPPEIKSHWQSLVRAGDFSSNGLLVLADRVGENLSVESAEHVRAMAEIAPNHLYGGTQ